MIGTTDKEKNKIRQPQAMGEVVDNVILFAVAGTVFGYIFDSVLVGGIGLVIFACLGLVIGLREQN